MMGLCTKRRIYILFLTITILQIVCTGVRQIFDFLGPLWALIFTNFLNIVFSIFGFFGSYTRRKHYLISYLVWCLGWGGWNVFIICLYIPLPSLKTYKSSILSLGTGGFSWWETRAPGCIPDWESENELLVTNCLFDPRILESAQAGIQVLLSLLAIPCCFVLLFLPSDKTGAESEMEEEKTNGPTFFSLSRPNSSSLKRPPSRTSTARRQPNGQLETDRGGTLLDDRLRPMTPRRVKRRSARSIQSQRYGPQLNPNIPGPSNLNERSSANGRNSLRSNSSRRSHRNSKRKTNHHFMSPVNRLMMQQQQQNHLDSETSHDEPHRRYPLRDQGHVNPVYLGPQSPPHPPPRPPSARSSYSNYHPARLPMGVSQGGNLNPNVLNLNQNIFTNAAFDNSPEYNQSQFSNNSRTTFGDEEMVSFLPSNYATAATNQLSRREVPNPNPNLNFFASIHQQQMQRQEQLQQNNLMKTLTSQRSPSISNNPTLVYPLAHSPVSQESFPMWGVAQAQVPISPKPLNQMKANGMAVKMSPGKLSSSRQQVNSETVI